MKIHVDDLRVIRALQVAPRASFARIGAALGLPEATVARRYRALRRGGMLRVVGLVNPLTVGQHSWMVRVRCRPGGAESLATALAQRDDIAWVALSAGGSEVTFSSRSLSAQERDTLLTRRLPRATTVLGIEASVVLHQFRGLHADDFAGLAHHLSAAETASLRAGAGTRLSDVEAPVRLEPVDHALLATLARDGRASYAELAAAAGISEGRATRRLAHLIGAGAVVLDVDLALAALGYTANAYLFLRITPGLLQDAGQALARMPEVAFAAAISGPNNLVASVACRDLAELYLLATARVGRLDGVQGMEISPILRTVKQSGARTDGGLLADPGAGVA